jgi:hypothetical protein
VPSGAGRSSVARSPSASPSHGPVGLLQDHWHPIVQPRHVGVRAGSDNGKSPQHGAIQPTTTFPQASECHRLPVVAGDCKGLLLAFASLPFVECIGRHQAPTLRKSAAEHPGRGDGFGTGVDGVLRLRRVLGPVRYEALLHQIKVALAGLGVPTHYHCVLRKGDVPGRRDVRQRIHRPEEARDELERLGAGVAATHWRSIFRAPGWTPTARFRCGLSRFALPNSSHHPVFRINARHLLVMGNNLRAACRMAPTYRAGDPPSYRTAGRAQCLAAHGTCRPKAAGTGSFRLNSRVRPFFSAIQVRILNGRSWPEAEWQVRSVRGRKAAVRSAFSDSPDSTRDGHTATTRQSSKAVTRGRRSASGLHPMRPPSGRSHEPETGNQHQSGARYGAAMPSMRWYRWWLA